MSWTLQIGDSNGTHLSYSNSNSGPGHDAGDEGYYEDHDDDEYHDYSERRSRRDRRGHRHGDSTREHHDSGRRRRHRSRNLDDGGEDGRSRSRSHYHPSCSLGMHYDGQYGHGNFTIADAVIQQNPALIQGPLPFFPLAGAEAGVPGSASGRGKVLGGVGEDKAGRPP
ncbi:hypothetical protein DL770_009925 [Monosporascus sp. CRB-9-2]|nr:hypothetical protein DL770_009925 [Monosporascus sp. CRB-9-2]